MGFWKKIFNKFSAHKAARAANFDDHILKKDRDY